MKDRLIELLHEGHFIGDGDGCLGRFKYNDALQDMPFVNLLSEPVCIEAVKAMNGARIAGCLHVTPQTAVLIKILSRLPGVCLRR